MPSELPLGHKIPKALWLQRLEIVMLISIWWVSAVVVVLVIRWTVEGGPDSLFPYAFAFTSLVQPAVGLLAWVLSKLQRRPPLPKPTGLEVACLLALGLLQGGEIGLTNKALEFLTAATRTMISSTSVFFMMVFARLWGIESLGPLRVASAALFVVGGVCQAAGKSEAPGHLTQFKGIVIQVGSILLSSQRWVLAQRVLQHSPKDSALGQMSKLQLLAITLPITGIVSLVLALICEGPVYSPELLLRPALAANFAVVTTGLAAMLWAELALVKRLSAVAFKVLSTVHLIPIVAAGVVFQHNHVGASAGGGFVICLIAAFVYAAARLEDERHARGPCFGATFDSPATAATAASPPWRA